MGEFLDKAISALNALPEEDRERIAAEIIERLEDKSEWDRLVSSEQSQKWLEEMARDALASYSKISKRVTRNLISLPPSENKFRGEAYWRYFDELPHDVRVRAEKNYLLWKENPKDPSLRFKRIHPDLPIYSFRVGLHYRTVGVQSDDNRIIWFWIGPLEAYARIIES